jgi:anti-sigma factor RsiW
VPRDVVALVSADDFVSAVRVYADRINDLLRRNGIPPVEAVEIAETHALALLDAVVNAPDTVVDLAGWWFARAIEVTSATAAAEAPADDEAVSMLAGTETEARVRDALAGLSEAESAVVMLRDGYDLPPQAVGVALRRGGEAAAELTAAGRLGLVAAYDERRPPNLLGHSGRTTVDLTSLSRLADGTLDTPRAAPLRRHLSSCTACAEVVEALERGRRLAAGLPIIAMEDEAREGLIERIGQRAASVLPSHDTVLRVVDEDHDPGPAISPVIAIVVLVLALALGITLGVMSRSGSHLPSSLATTPAPTQPPVSPLFSPTSSPHRRHPRSTASGSVSPSSSPTTVGPASASASPSLTPSTGPGQGANPLVVLSPSAGRQGTSIVVTGTGWPPGTRVFVSYASRPASSARVDSVGDFSAHAVANAVLPGARRITVTDGTQSVTVTFSQTF